MNTQTDSETTDRLLAAAMQLHEAAQVDQARAAYERLLEVAPDHPDGLHMLGVLEGQYGSDDRALELIGRAIAINPREPMFHNNLGNVYLGIQRPEEAERSYRAAIDLDPTRFDALNNLAVLQGRRGDFAGAEATFQKVLQIAPGFTDARENLANLYVRQGRVVEAVRQCALGLVTSPRNAALRRMLGMAYGSLGMHDQALELFRKWHEEEPEHIVPRHHLAALTGEQIPERASDDYVRHTFDSFANSFDAKLAELGYKAPRLVGECVAQALGAPARRLRVVDAGCGTGLCAEWLVPYARTLVGVDLSLPMLKKAGARDAYDELVAGELVAFLQQRPRSFDLLVSADTLCYFGVLDAFAAAARGSLDAGALLVFTVEAHDDIEGAPDFRLQAHGRYSHRRGYVVSALAAAGFEGTQTDAVVLRSEAGEPVHGWLVHARTPQNEARDG